MIIITRVCVIIYPTALRLYRRTENKINRLPPHIRLTGKPKFIRVFRLFPITIDDVTVIVVSTVYRVRFAFPVSPLPVVTHKSSF